MRFSDLPRNPDRRTLRQFAALCLIVFGAIAATQYFRHDNFAAAMILGAIALGTGIPGLLFPALMKPIFVGWLILVFPIGWLVSHLILLLVFWGIFVPVGLVLRLVGHDPLRLRKPATSSYWENKTQQRDPRRYLKQF